MLHELRHRHRWQLCRNIHQPSAEHRTTWQRLSHQFRILRCWCRNIFMDLEEDVQLRPDLKRGVLSEDGIWDLLADYRDIQKKKQ